MLEQCVIETHTFYANDTDICFYTGRCVYAEKLLLLRPTLFMQMIQIFLFMLERCVVIETHTFLTISKTVSPCLHV